MQTKRTHAAVFTHMRVWVIERTEREIVKPAVQREVLPSGGQNKRAEGRRYKMIDEQSPDGLHIFASQSRNTLILFYMFSLSSPYILRISPFFFCLFFLARFFCFTLYWLQFIWAIACLAPSHPLYCFYRLINSVFQREAIGRRKRKIKKSCNCLLSVDRPPYAQFRLVN